MSLKILASSIADQLGAEVVGLDPASQIELQNLTFDSRKVVAGSGFVAISGFKNDGHLFLDDAIQAGAGWLVVEKREALGGRPGFVVSNSNTALSQLAAIAFRYPSRQLKTIGLTGTNGKTTTNWMLYHLLNQLDLTCLRIGTLGIAAENIFNYPGDLTTPDAVQVQSVMRQALDSGVRSCVMEVSSHALSQGRAENIDFDVAVFTNLTRDHLDYHNDMEQYFIAKSQLFELLAKSSKSDPAAVINLDSVYGRRLHQRIAALKLRDLSFGEAEDAKVRIVDFKQVTSGSKLELAYLNERFVLQTGFIGKHNAQNLAAAFACALGLGFDPLKVSTVFPLVPQVPGRLEGLNNSKIAVFVDYAHTPDALQNALLAVREVCSGRLWVIFGCGGDRDKGKRPEMACVASKYADLVVVTSDNPRTESPQTIIDDILSGGVAAEIIEVDRCRAIEQTLRACQDGDVVLIAGKGHEDYQIIGTTKSHFSDQEIAREILNSNRLQ